MASTSSSSIQKSFKYDVFLSFRGEDTRKNFVDHLYYALTQKGIETYKDDVKIKQGKMISDELIKAIEDSKFYIIVFSKTYASSSWCLEELVKIMECQTMDEHTAYPVFYDVEPTEVRKQSGSVGDAFAKHKEDEAAGKWRKALKEASDLAGFELKSIGNGHEAAFIHKIVQEILLELRFINLTTDRNLIGMDTRINEVTSYLEPHVDEVRMIGIWGMGGAGKTTLARGVFDHLSIQFEGQSFVENVREVSKTSFPGLKSLQEQILSDVLNDRSIKVSSVFDGKNMMQRMMRGRKVLVVLDDVDDKDQLEALAGDRNWFKPGSTIIITTRDKQVLVAHRVRLIHNVTLLSQAEAGCLFSRCAFGREDPIQGYEELSRKVIQYAHGLPLTIKITGSFLFGQSEPYWLNAIKRLEIIPLAATIDRLEISFDSLEKEYKEIFLDVACILRGWDKNEAIRVLESRGFHAEVGLRVLEQKSLITYNTYGQLGMHDHLEEMGRNIVCRSHPNEPQRHSRLWNNEEIEYILTNKLGTLETKCLSLKSDDLSAEITIKGLANMKDLRFLDIQSTDRHVNWEFDKVSEYLPCSLRFMRWKYFPLSSLPNTFQGIHLVVLQLRHSKIVELWKDGEQKVLNNLRFFTIGYSKLRTFDLRLAPNLEQLTIQYCRDFVELRIPVGHHSKLEYLELMGSKLTNLHLENTPNIKTLVLGRCIEWVEFQMPAQSLKLEHLDLSYNSKFKTIRLGSSPSLKTLKLNSCDDLVDIQMCAESLKLEHLDLSYNSKLKTIHLGSTPSLKTLKLNSCDDLVELQMCAESLKLEHLDLSSNSKLKTIHLGSTPSLKTLLLNSCDDLAELQMSAKIIKLEHLDLSRNSKLKTIHLVSTPSLKTLLLNSCDDLVELQMPAESLKLEHLDLSYNSKLKTIHFGSTPSLKTLKLNSCDGLVELQMCVESLKLEHLNLSHNSKLKTIHLGSAPNLKTLLLNRCQDVVELQMPIESLKLEHLDLSYNSKLKTIQFGSTPSLKTLKLNSCDDLVEFQMPAQSLKLEHLDLSHNSKLKTIHLGSAPNLKTLLLNRCQDVVELQMHAESLKLEHLDLSYNSKLKTIQFGSTPGLKTLKLNSCDDLVEFQMSAESLKLEHLDLSRNSKLKTIHLGSTPNLKTLLLNSCDDLVELQMHAESLKLEHLDLSRNSKLKTIHFGSTPSLKTLKLNCCDDLVELQMSAESLKLEHLDLSRNSKLKTVHLGSTPNLKTLLLNRCENLVELQMPAASLKLEHLDLSNNSKLKTIHLGCTPNLERLILLGCKFLVLLPELGCVKCLKELNIQDTGIRCLHKSFSS